MSAILDGAALRLEPELTIYTASALRAALVAALERGGAVLALDLADVCEIDSAGMQLLLAARNAAAARGGALQLQGCSPALRDACALFGLDPVSLTGVRNDA